MNYEKKETPMVSVSMLAYNHGNYIKQALDGILMQEVDFSYEIVIGEDCSTDNTREIVIEYQKKYPDKIKLILHESNVGMHENGNAVRRQCNGKYRASCEGDDYWVDPYKLKKQVEFLENHPEYIGTAHKVQAVDEHGNYKENYKKNIYCKDKVYTLEHAQKGIMPGQSASRVYRNILRDDRVAKKELERCKANGDMKMALYLVLHGKFYCFDEVMSHYRLTEEGDSWTARTKNKNMSLYLFKSYVDLAIMAKNLKGINMDYSTQYLYHGTGAFVSFIKKPNRENFEILSYIYKDYNNKLEMTLYIVKRIVRYPFKKINKKLIKLRGMQDNAK